MVELIKLEKKGDHNFLVKGHLFESTLGLTLMFCFLELAFFLLCF